MYPLDFEEFAYANKVSPKIIAALRKSFQEKTPVDAVIHEKMMELFRLYLEDIFDLIPSELNSKNKRFILKNLNENFKFSRYSNSFLWLRDAGVALPAFCANEPTVPLLLSKATNLFKLFLADVGLLAAMYMNDIQIKILNREKDINFGAVYENAAAQELKTHGFDLYYFNSAYTAEQNHLDRRN